VAKCLVTLLQLDKYSSVCDIVNAAVKRYFPRFFPSVESNGPMVTYRRDAFNEVSW
jgi:hypothetical protein